MRSDVYTTRCSIRTSRFITTMFAAHCTNQPTSQCPCPLEYLFLLAVEAIETVNDRRNVLAELPPRADAVGFG